MTLASLLRRDAVRIGLVGLVGFAAPMTIGLAVGIPEPVVHDEFSYLLGAETFAAGRLTNPPHPVGRHFESMHVLREPTYMTKYPPAQSLVLALGILLGHPILGVWLSAAAMAVATYWMLLGWTTPRWALIGTLLSVILFGTTGSWAQTYWGGCVAATGGALLFGAVARVRRRIEFRDASILGFSLVLLANSRPFEGMVLAGGAAVLLLLGLRHERRWRLRALKTVLPVVLVLATGGALMMSYNRAVTGDALTMPYDVYQTRYDSNPIFAFLPRNEVADDLTPRLRRFDDEFSIPRFEESQARLFHVTEAVSRVRRIAVFFFSDVTLAAVLLTLPWLLASGKTRTVILLLTYLFLAQSLSMWWFPHYSAVATSLVVLLSVEALRRLSLLRGRPGRFRMRPMWIVLVLVAEWGMAEAPLGALARAVSGGTGQPEASNLLVGIDGRATTPDPFPRSRAQVAQYLLDQDGYQLAVVSYADDTPIGNEWVYNAPDIDGSRLVWAHDLGQNEELLSYFGERTIWTVDVAVGNVTVSPYLAP